MKFNTLVDLFLTNSQKNPPASYFYLRNAETIENSLSHELLAKKAKRLAAWLIKNGFSGQRAMLVFPPGLEFIEAFMACLIAKVVAVPVAPAPLTGDKNKVTRMISILRDCQPQIVLGVTQTLEKAPQFIEQNKEFSHLTWFSLDTFNDGEKYDGLNAELPQKDDLALLQYTSGSTAQPKGVMLSHGNILHNLELWGHGLGHDADSKMMCWVPHFHDLGLLYGVLFPLFQGISAYLMPAASVVQNPLRWLQAISNHGGTHSMGPNFIYDHCVERISHDDCSSLDLSSWRMSLNAAEPIRFDIVKRFNEKFAPYGLSPNTLTAAWGLAESTCLVTGQDWHAPMRSLRLSPAGLAQNTLVAAADHETANEIVSCGVPVKDMVVKVVNPASFEECAPGQIGELWVQGKSVSSGYWNRPEENKRTFGARLAGDPDGPVFMRTGDLGFFEQGEIFTTGRMKDLIIVRGENYYPQDAEWVIEQSHPAFKPSCCAVFSVEGDKEEKVVVVQELIRHADRWSYDEMFTAVRRGLGSVYDLPIESIVLIRPGTTAKTSSGKIQRGKSKASYLENSLQVIARWDRNPATAPGATPAEAVAVPSKTAPQNPKHPQQQEVESFLINRIAKIAALPEASIAPQRPFADFGLGSLDSTLLADELAKRFDLAIPATVFYDFPSIRQLAQHLANGDQTSVPAASAKNQDDDAIVVVGIGCRFPGAEDPDAYWQLLAEAGISTSTRTQANQTPRHGGFLANATCFDNEFFAITNREAACLDPQQRIALEVAWQALEDADTKPAELAGSNTGVFFGASAFDYGSLQLSESVLDSYSCQGSVLAVIANRIAYHFDFHGPSFVVDTACSSALTAVHLACRSLRDDECTTAVVGAVNLVLAEEWDNPLTKAGMLSADGSCKTFDAGANGYVRGEGCGVLVLKRQADAIRDGNRIYGAILASSLNQDGRSNGLTAPNGNAQETLLRTALSKAALPPAALSYIEAHGTGTPLGDPIECRALARVLGERASPCYVGSVKANIGHLEAAAGMAGLIKTLLMLKHDRIPAQVNFNHLNPLIELGSTLAIPLTAKPWSQPEGQRRYASVSAFGFSGANACVIVGDALAKAETTPASPARVLPFILTARDRPALRRLAGRYAKYLAKLPAQDWQHFLYTLSCRRTEHATRFFAVADTPANLLQKLQAVANGSDSGVSVSASQSLKTAFVFSGQGIPLASTGRELYEHLPTFKDALDQCNAVLEPLLGRSLTSLLYAPELESELSRPGIAQPVQFALQYALAESFAALGIKPDLLMGHSLGEYAALVTAGAMSVEVALRLVAARGELAEHYSKPGEMAAIFADEASVTAAIKESGLAVDLAAVNGSFHCVVAGEADAITAFCQFVAQMPDIATAIAAPPVYSKLPLPVAPATYQSFTATRDLLLSKLLLAQLQALGMFTQDHFNLTQWQREINMPGLYRRWLEQSVRVLTAQGFLRQEGDTLSLVHSLAEAEAWDEWQQHSAIWLQDPQLHAQIKLLDTTMKALPQILQGQIAATAVLFPNGSISLVEGIYKNSLIADYFNEVLAESLVQFIEERLRHNPSSKIRIIEVGAGTGGTSALLFDRLSAYSQHIAEYCYTDISSAFLLHARETFLAKAPYLTTRLFNIEKELAEQAMDPGFFDVVIASNVLHATRDMRNTLHHCKALLKSQGVLLVNEISDFSLFTHLSFGLLEGWWLYSDPSLRTPGSPALLPEVWRQVLQAEGFTQVQSPAAAAHGLGQQIIVAESDGILRPAATEFRKLKVQRAYHSALIEPMIPPFAELASECNFLPPRVPLISNVSGQLWPEGQRLDAHYLSRHLREPVRFADSLNRLAEEKVTVALEIGTKPVLCSIGQTHLSDRGPRWLPSLRNKGDDWRALLECLGQLYEAGSNIAWQELFRGLSTHSVYLPPYAFALTPHWFTQRTDAAKPQARPVITAVLAEPVTTAVAVPEATEHLSITSTLAAFLGRIIHVPADSIDCSQSFFEFGIDSISLMEFVRVVSSHFKVELTVSEIFEHYSTIDLVSQKLASSLELAEANL